QPFNPHFHWGARDMAGYPPSKKGYFAEKSTIKSYRKLCQTIIGSFSEFDPVFVLLLPAVIFALWPTDHHSGDQEAIADLIRQIRRHDGQSSGQAEQAAVIDAIVARWLADRAGHGVSGYFLNRFAPRQGILNHATFARSMPIEPEGFRDLSIRQACMAVGSLINHLRSGVPSTTSTIQDERNTI
ncbi:MAG TPA: DUF6025 family protein, partial [Herpetosiphonaceae bacterium]|nr:DUF6025 family protein [Herpetosiphonaceae bacterium]